MDNPYELLGMGAPWNAEGRVRFEAMLKKIMAGQGKSNGWGYPMMMDSPAPFEIVFGPDRVLIYNLYRELRVIYTDGRPHPPEDDLWPTTWGNSIGHWEGDTLVIDTIMVTNPNEFFQGGPPLSEEARYIERVRLDGDKLRLELTIEDPVTLSAPWKLDLALVRDEGFDRMIQVDWTNDRTGTEGDLNTIEPPADQREQ